MASATDNKVIMNGSGLVARSYDGTGATDGGLVSASDGTSLDQFSMIRGLLDAYQAIGNARALARAEQGIGAVLPILLRGTAVSSSANNLLPHWLFNVKYAHDGIAVDQVFEANGGIRALDSGEITAEMRAMLAAPRALSLYAEITGKTLYADMATAITLNAGSLIPSTGVLPRWMALNTATGAKTPVGGYPVWAQLSSAYNIADANNITARLITMRDAWQATVGELGPFAPMYNPDTNAGTWDAVFDYDLNGDGQYWALVDLAMDVSESAASRSVLIEYLDWLATDANWLPNAASFNDKITAMINRASALGFSSYAEVQSAVDAISLPKLGPPDIFRSTGAAHITDDPCFAALIMESALRLDTYQRPSGTGTVYLSVENVVHKAMALLQATYVSSGEMAGTFATGTDWRGYKHGAMMSSLSYALGWARRTGRTSIAALCETWLSGMVLWVDLNTRRTLSPWGARPWPFAIDWASGMTETIEFSTNVITSRTGREQRISKRRDFRRRLSYNYTMVTGKESANFQAILKARQNAPALVPQWHLSIPLAGATLPGANTVTLAEDAPAFVDAGVAVLVTQGTSQQMTFISSRIGRSIILEDSLDFAISEIGRLVPSVNAILDASTSSTKLSASYMQATVGFQVLPQEDYRTLADRPYPSNWISFIANAGFLWAKYVNNGSALNTRLPLQWPEASRFDFPIHTFTVGSDTREVIDRQPNWASVVSVDDAWSYDLVSYDAGPIMPMGGETFGRRTVKATWTFFTKDDREDFESLLKRLRGMQVACWVPSWTRDFEMTADMTLSNRIVVENNSFIDEGLLALPFMGICVLTKGGGMLCARVASSSVNGGVATLILDRDLGYLIRMDQVAKICALYRVRQASDVAEIQYHTQTVSECAISFITVDDGAIA